MFFLFWQAQVVAVEAPRFVNLRAIWLMLTPRQPRLIAPLAGALGVPAVRRMGAIHLPQLEGHPAVEVFARDRPGPSRGSHRAAGVSSDTGGVGMPYWPGRPGLSGGVCNAMGRMDSLECLRHWALVN
jgi:hypothetical protein